ncbi:MAG: type I 3-dehydroquinate dehydratase [Spirochaetaceae bacterium]|nr:type I 3-dehydroquinate dehydratase [Spirochaetaceae bacterium]
MPQICLSLTGKTIAEDLAALDRYRGLVDIVELRADLLDSSEAPYLRTFPENAGLPCILSVRRLSDGGAFVEGEGVRLVILAKALAYARQDHRANYAFVELEHDFRVPAIEESCRIFGTRIIRSRHEMEKPPEDLDAAYEQLKAEAGEIPKLAFMLRGAGDLAQILTWSSGLARSQERIIVGMGAYGLPSRVLAERLGSKMAYTSPLSAGLPGAAPGHLDPTSLEGQYRFHEIGRDTAVYALGGGKTVTASKTPQLQNGAFRSAGVDAIYLPFPAEDAGSFIAAIDAAGARGAAITVPLKEAILPYLAWKSPEVVDIGACNTIVRNAEGWAGYNTDAMGFERALIEFIGRGDLRGLRATIVGAGGAAKAVALVLARLGAGALVLNRTISKARDLAQRYGFAWGGCDEHSTERVADHADLIVQASIVGMEGEVQGDPLDWYDFTGREAVFDLIYRPDKTVMLERAAMAGCRTTNGWATLRYQAAAQYKLWTGREPPSVFFE